MVKVTANIFLSNSESEITKSKILMKKSLMFPVLTLLTLFILSSFGTKKTADRKAAVSTTAENKKTNNENELRVANDQFYSALNTMFTGNLLPMENIWSHGEDVTQLGPFGDRLTGWNNVRAEL